VRLWLVALPRGAPLGGDGRPSAKSSRCSFASKMALAAGERLLDAASPLLSRMILAARFPWPGPSVASLWRVPLKSGKLLPSGIDLCGLNNPLI